MKQKKIHPPEASELRRCAEERLRKSQPNESASESDMQRLVHELQVHQIELEMQNEELQKARDEMEAGLERYSDLYDFAPVGYLTLDREGAICEANLASATLLGTERSRLIQRRLVAYFSEDGRPVFTTFLLRVFGSNSREFCELKLLKEGAAPIDVRIEGVVSDSGRECRAIIADITEHKQAEEDRLILNKLQSTGTLASGIAHDFNNLLAIIFLNLDMADINMKSGEEFSLFLREAKQAATLAGRLTQQLITFSHGGAPVRKPTPLPDLLREAVRLALSGSRVCCDYSFPADLWPAVAEPGQIAQVIQNMSLNAKEAMPEGGAILVRAENAILASREHPTLPAGDYVRISISDQGGGIAKEVAPRIFDPYFSTKRRGDQKGMGLGLTICHHIVRKHGGAIEVESVAGVGTTFHILLPASRNPLGDVDVMEASGPDQVARPGKILVMDDEEWLRNTLGTLLHKMGHEVELVEEGHRAIEAYAGAIAQRRPFDAVLLDLTIRGGMGGLDTIRALKQIDPAVKAIVMSGYTDDPVLHESQIHGFKAVLKKPFDSGHLQATLARLMTDAP